MKNDNQGIGSRKKLNTIWANRKKNQIYYRHRKSDTTLEPNSNQFSATQGTVEPLVLAQSSTEGSPATFRDKNERPDDQLELLNVNENIMTEAKSNDNY